MTLGTMVRVYFLSAVVCFGLDMLWLGVLARDFYQKQLATILRPDVQWAPAVGFYLLFVVAVMVFAVVPALERGSLGRAVWSGACRLFGPRGSMRSLPRVGGLCHLRPDQPRPRARLPGHCRGGGHGVGHDDLGGGGGSRVRLRALAQVAHSRPIVRPVCKTFTASVVSI